MEVLQLIACPLLIVLLSLLLRTSKSLAMAASLLIWIQVAIATHVLYPALFGSSSVTIAPGLVVDHLGAMFALLTQVVVACAVCHAQVFFDHEVARNDEDKKFVRVFYICTALFLISMTAVFCCDNIGFLWISVEATTLCSTPLVYYYRTKHSIEAAWKYLITCSVGIAFALLGTILIFAASQHGTDHGSLNFSSLSAQASLLQYPLLRLGFLFCLLGYGTKAGIFPLHSWLPDAHSEAPAPASAMLSGGLLNCALFAIWRLSELVVASGHPNLIRNTEITAGVITVVAASLFLVHQHGIKRMLAYSSIENVGLMLTAIGLGSGPLFFLLALNHSAAKVALFLLSGNIIQATGSKEIARIRGILTSNPAWAAAFVCAALAVTGSPPFGAFIAEWGLLTTGSQMNLWVLVVVLIFALSLSFLAVTRHVARMICGTPRVSKEQIRPFASTLIPACLVVVALVAGITNLTAFLQ